MQYLLIALGLLLVAVGLYFAVRGFGPGTSSSGWHGLRIEGPPWLILVAIGVTLIVFSAVHEWPTTTLTRADAAGIGIGSTTESTLVDVTAPSPDVTTSGQSTTSTSSHTTESGNSTSSSRDTTTETAPVSDPDTTTTTEVPPDTTTSITAAAPALTDCLPYDPGKLRITDEGTRGWLLTDGSSRMKVLDNGTDAQAALAVAQRHTSHCFIGRDNTRPNRANYIVEFWIGSSGLTPTVEAPDCIPYHPTKLSITDEGANGWLLSEGPSRMLMLDTKADAELALAAVKTWSAQCFVGRDNKRADRMQYIMQYWQ